MAGMRSHLPWLYDAERQEFTTPAGVVSLHDMAAIRYGLATNHIDLTGPWNGWRIRGATLRGPLGSSMTVRPETAAQFGRWLRETEARHSLSLGYPASSTRARLVVVK